MMIITPCSIVKYNVLIKQSSYWFLLYHDWLYKERDMKLLFDFLGMFQIVVIFYNNPSERKIMSMTTIKPVYDLRDYNKVLKDCSKSKPVMLTKNGHGVFHCNVYR